ADDTAAVGLADALVPEAHAEDRNPAAEALDDRHRDPRLVGRARPGRDHDLRGREALDLVEADLIVAVNAHVLAELAEILHEVVGERVVIVDHEEHVYALPAPFR